MHWLTEWCLAANQDCFGNHALEVAEATAGSPLDGGNIALAIFILILLLSVLLGGVYVYVTRCRYNSNLRLPLIYPHPYRQITVETEFDNPLYETGGQDTREYEVSIWESSQKIFVKRDKTDRPDLTLHTLLSRFSTQEEAM